MGNVYILSLLDTLYKFITTRKFLMSVAMQYHCRLSIIGCVLKLEAAEGRGGSKQKIWLLFHLVDERSTGSKVFINIMQ